MEFTVDIKAILKAAKQVIIAPKKFFEKAKKEKGWKGAFVFVLVAAALGHILTAIYSALIYPLISPSLSQSLEVPSTQYEVGQVVMASVISYILTLGMSFIWGGALKVWLSLFRVSSTFDQSYRVMVYSRTPNYLFSWLPFINFAAVLYSFYLLMIGLEKEYGMPRKKALIVIISSIVVIFIASALVISFIPTI